MGLRKNLWLCLLIFTINQSCKNNKKPKYANEELLTNYLQKIQNLTIKTDKNYDIAIMQIGMCGACTEFNKVKLVAYFSKVNNLNTKILILSEKDEKIQRYFQSNCDSDLIILLDNGIDISRYGLRSSKDLLLKINNNTVSDYLFLEGK